MVNSNIGLLNLSDIDFDLSVSFKVKSDDAIGLPIIWFPIHV